MKKAMSPDEIKHFLISLDTEAGSTTVRDFGADYDAAQAAYAEAEQADTGSRLDIVLISADSLETIEQTHSSYFNDGNAGLKELLPG
jgi:hypothetical protein